MYFIGAGISLYDRSDPKESAMQIDNIYQLDIFSFFDYIKSIKYGYQDASGNLHFIDDENFTVRDYVFSSPSEIVRNHCGWCWDVANLISCYCERHHLEHITLFMEYLSAELHQTHTQVFVFYNGNWHAAPDNSSPDQFGNNGYISLEECKRNFVGSFVAFLKYTLKEKYDENYLLLNEIHCKIEAGISDDEYLQLARQ